MSEAAQVAASLAAFGVLVFFGGVAGLYRRRQEARRLRGFVATFTQTKDRPPDSGVLKRPADHSWLTVGLDRKIGQSSLGQKLQLQLIRSGLKITANQFILGQIGAAVAVFILSQTVLFPSQGSMALLLSLGMTAPCLLLPRFVLRFLQNRRVNRFELQLAQAVDVMAGALQAGSSLPQAFDLVSREMPDPIGTEFGKMMAEARLGVPLDQGLQTMVERVPSMDLEMLVSAINIQYKVGGNLSHILKTIAHTIRERVRIRGELNTLTAQARISSYIISLLPVAVVVALMFISPSYIMKLFDPGITRLLLVGGIMGMVTGFYVMKRIATIEV